MPRSRHQKGSHHHFVIFTNRKAAGFQARYIRKLTDAIKKRGAYYTVFEPDSAMNLYKQARQVRSIVQQRASSDPSVARRGEITSLVAIGGDGTFNLVARAGLEIDLPVGVIPCGRINNIARALLGEPDLDVAVKKVVQGDYRKFDVGTAADQAFFGSVGLGFVPHLAAELADRKIPRWGIGWSQAGAKAAAGVAVNKTVIKIDAFRFEVTPVMISIHLLPWAAGLPFSPTSLTNDGMAEVIFDMGTKLGDFSSFTRMIYRKKYLYGTDIRLFRGKVITIQPTKGQTLYLDGELIPLPANILSVTVGDRQVKMFC
ncbi:MAG TPA: diacylglycerol kinase family protein [Candidatus Acidoferrum sp.]|nr:diacylglycerol kinase family protein [Candidatus Acidoferrum sp.]